MLEIMRKIILATVSLFVLSTLFFLSSLFAKPAQAEIQCNPSGLSVIDQGSAPTVTINATGADVGRTVTLQIRQSGNILAGKEQTVTLAAGNNTVTFAVLPPGDYAYIMQSNDSCAGGVTVKPASNPSKYYCHNKGQAYNSCDLSANNSSSGPFDTSAGCMADCKQPKNNNKTTQPPPWSWKKRVDSCGIRTALGCVPIDSVQGFFQFFLKFAIGISGGVILLMVIFTGYTIVTSAGNPEKLAGAKENIVAILTGLLLIAFSLVLLQTIGADILKLPTF